MPRKATTPDAAYLEERKAYLASLTAQGMIRGSDPWLEASLLWESENDPRGLARVAAIDRINRMRGNYKSDDDKMRTPEEVETLLGTNLTRYLKIAGLIGPEPSAPQVIDAPR